MKRRPRRSKPIEPLTFVVTEVSLGADGNPIYRPTTEITCYFGSDRRKPTVTDLEPD